MLNKTLFRPVFFIFIWLLACANECDAQIKFPIGNWGVRVGLNATSIMNYEAYNYNEALPNSTYTNKNGFLIATFARCNIKNFFLQPEVAWNRYNRSCSFSVPNENISYYYPASVLNIESKSLNTNFLLGYHIVKDNPYLFGVYGGTALIGTYKTKYSIENEIYTKNNISLNYTGIFGFSINISKICFDIRYELCLPNSNMNLNGISNIPEKFQDIKIKKIESILSFSCGIML